jgi:methionine-rich copper-binding protein CopC
MDFRKLTIPMALALLAGLFLLVSAAVYFTRGKSARWVSRKLRLGGLMLSLMAVLQSCDPLGLSGVPEDREPPYTCYMVAEPGIVTDLFFLEGIADSTVTVNLPNGNKLKGEIRKRTQANYSFAVYKNDTTKVQIESVLARDGAYDEDTESFEIEINKELQKGDYIIRFFVTSAEQQPEWSHQFVYLKIK